MSGGDEAASGLGSESPVQAALGPRSPGSGRLEDQEVGKECPRARMTFAWPRLQLRPPRDQEVGGAESDSCRGPGSSSKTWNQQTLADEI